MDDNYDASSPFLNNGLKADVFHTAGHLHETNTALNELKRTGHRAPINFLYVVEEIPSVPGEDLPRKILPILGRKL